MAKIPRRTPGNQKSGFFETAIPQKVSREARITWRTNRFSVATAYIGEMLCLMIHPLNSQAEIALPNGRSRTFKRAEDGMRQSVDFPCDRELLKKRWDGHSSIRSGDYFFRRLRVIAHRGILSTITNIQKE